MAIGLLIFLLFVMGFVALALLQRNEQAKREAFIRSFELPVGLFEALRKKRPELALKDCQLVAHGLRQFFLAHLKSQRRYVSMPSQLADDLWHEFILFTRNYQVFCDKAFGRFLHHTPAVAMQNNKAGGDDSGDAVARSQAGLRRVWVQCCRQDNINPLKPLRLPLLFALDAKFNIADGFHYQAVCTPGSAAAAGTPSATQADGRPLGQRRVIYCGSEIADIHIHNRSGGGCGGGCGGTNTDGGGDGCGGGGCGGGD